VTESLQIRLPSQAPTAATHSPAPSRVIPEYLESSRCVVPPPMPSAEAAPHLSVLAMDIRDFWILEMRQRMQDLLGLLSDYGAGPLPSWDGVVVAGVLDRFGKKSKLKPPVWDLLLEKCGSQSINPYKFLQYTARRWSGTSPPVPNFILCEEALQHYRSAPREEERARISLGIQQDHARTMFADFCRDSSFSSDAARWRAVVLDRRRPLTSLFCHCLACELGMWAEADKRRPAAARQYMLDRDLYDNVWAQYLPVTLSSLTIDQLLKAATVGTT